jgi:hypothetical protein
MRITAKRLSMAAALVLLAHAAGGCADRVYDGSSSFYDQHPNYRTQPDYMHPGDADDADPHANRPW